MSHVFLAAGFAIAVSAWAGGPDPVLHSSARLVQVSVIAEDRRGQPIRDLQAEDFRLRDNRERRKIHLFAVSETSASESSAPQQPSGPVTALGAPTNNIGAVGGPAAVTVIVIDYLNTDWTDQVYCTRELLAYLRKIRPEDRIAIYTMGNAGLRVLHDFATDSSDLVAAVAASKGEILARGKSTSPVDPSAELSALLAPGGPDAREARMQQIMEEVRVSQTLPTLKMFEQLAQILEGISGSHEPGLDFRRHLDTELGQHGRDCPPQSERASHHAGAGLGRA